MHAGSDLHGIKYYLAKIFRNTCFDGKFMLLNDSLNE
jgi:hypothetical protein